MDKYEKEIKLISENYKSAESLIAQALFAIANEMACDREERMKIHYSNYYKF